MHDRDDDIRRGRGGLRLFRFAAGGLQQKAKKEQGENAMAWNHACLRWNLAVSGKKRGVADKSRFDYMRERILNVMLHMPQGMSLGKGATTMSSTHGYDCSGSMLRIVRILIFCLGLGVFGAVQVWAGDALPADDEEKRQAELFKYLNTPWVGDLEGMRQRRYIRVLVTYSRTNYYLDGAATKGFTAELAKNFEKWLNKRLKTGRYPIHVACIPVRRDELLPALNAGRGDIAAASLSITLEREKLVAFSSPWATDVREIVVMGPESPPLASIEDLSGQEVYVRRSSSYFETLESLNTRFAAQGRPPVHIRLADEDLESEDIMEMVGAGILPLTVVDGYRARLWGEVLPGVVVRDDLVAAQGQRLAWAMRQDSPELQALVNEFVQAFLLSPDLAYMGRKYFGRAGYLQNPKASEDMRRFNEAARYFRKYGRQYDLDFLLLAAQGYQESRLDQGAVSPAGAVGVMQLLPSTAAGSPIYLPNIRHLETNIHAGAKYYRFLIDRYYNDPAISPLNRLLFAFAGYNAGPGNMARMRRLTTDMGLDPNRWFANVEVAAGKVTGQETVRYVGNIYKYYLAYRMVIEREEERERARHRLRSL